MSGFTTLSPQASNGAPTPTRASVFIIDDDRSLLRLLRVIFLDANFEVQAFPEAGAALEQVRAAAPDAIILDLEMPIMDGREFYRALREAGIETPVLILSAYGAHTAQAELGAQGFVDKPFEPEQLIDAVVRLLQRQQV